MTDASVRSALRSATPLVVIEAPAGCGKTYQGAEYANEVAQQVGSGRVLVLTHTHAASDVFASRASGLGQRIETRTIDSLVSEIASAYHLPLNLPADTSIWARARGDTGHAELATKVATLLRSAPAIASALSARYPIVICDEHQDASADQHRIAIAYYNAGAKVRFFGDPMQRIHSDKATAALDAERWTNLIAAAGGAEVLNTPHRWIDGSEELGQWILAARAALRAGNPVDLRSATLPAAVGVIVAENTSRRYGGYQVANAQRQPIDATLRAARNVLVLTPYNTTVGSLRPFFGRRIPVWEGHTRSDLSALVETLKKHTGNPQEIAKAVVKFMQESMKGFSDTAYATAFLREIEEGCSKSRRGKPATLQELARIILARPDHIGCAQLLRSVYKLKQTDAQFSDLELDYSREFWDAVRLEEFACPEEGFAELAHRRTHARKGPPSTAISTVHKAKGLECEHVVLMPCDGKNFRDTLAARCLLYVAMSRATRSLTLVVSRQDPSVLFRF